ncbi:hypothetical protein, partial [Mesorhizobium metallidurans]|uniref:hypothetical protein n=1 Tax=Mesorhizobium metallidurans TaxID=489722 RepID=UPI001FCAEAD5
EQRSAGARDGSTNLCDVPATRVVPRPEFALFDLLRSPYLGRSIVQPRRSLMQFQEKCETVFRPELRKNKQIERFGVSVKR